MTDELFERRWGVLEGGYRWVKTQPWLPFSETAREDIYLVPAPAIGWARVYSPMGKEYSAVFLAFAETEPTEEGILGFANRYGALRLDEQVILSAEEYPKLPGLTESSGDVEMYWALGWGEKLSLWQDQITAMRRAITLWQAVNSGKVSELRRYVSWTSERVVKCEFEDGYYESVALDGGMGGAAPLMRTGDVLIPARYFLHRMINGQLSEHTSMRLLLNEHGNSELHVVTHHLLGALWLQFANAVGGNREFRRCAECGTYFEVSPDRARKSKRYCSDACRFKAYRRRQEEARRLYSEGTPIEEIARILESEPSTVERWISSG
jgi:hypothetical protein